MSMLSKLLIVSVSMLSLAIGYDMIAFGATKLNVVVLCSLIATAILAKLSQQNRLRSIILVFILVPIASARSFSVFYGASFSEGLESILIVIVLMAVLIHCTDAARNIVDGT